MEDNPGHATKPQRRRIMLAAGACAVGGGALFLSQQHHATKSWPHGTPLNVNIAGLPEGKLKTVEWQGKPVWILRRRAGEIAALQKGGDTLADADSRSSLQPPYTKNALRSLRPEIFVAIGLCTHQGCTPALNGDHFLCPCHTSKYDLAGRVFRAGPAEANLVIPAYRFDGDNKLVIGEDA
jgi:ubiquinol-cytochrome c reductase iron-sulfur subunit